LYAIILNNGNYFSGGNRSSAKETKFLQTDIIYDWGQSLNPAVDLGQVCYKLNPNQGLS
jgi:hypothetical protein